MMSQAFYYLHITTNAQSAYPRSHNKFSRYFCFKVIYNKLFYHKIVFCFKQKYMLIYFCQIKLKVMLPLYNDQVLLLTVLAIIHRSSL